MIPMRTPQERQIEAKRRAYEAAKPQSFDEDPRLQDVAYKLGFILQDYRNQHQQITKRTARDMQDIAYDYVLKCRRQGIAVPDLQLVFFVAMNQVAVWPAALDQTELQRRLHTFIVHRQRHGLSVDAQDIAKGVRRAYPDYSFSRHLTLPPSVKKSNSQEIQQ